MQLSASIAAERERETGINKQVRKLILYLPFQVYFALLSWPKLEINVPCRLIRSTGKWNVSIEKVTLFYNAEILKASPFS